MGLHTLEELVQAQRELCLAEEGRLQYWSGLAERAQARGEVPAFSFEGLQQRLERLKATEILLASFAAGLRAIEPLRTA